MAARACPWVLLVANACIRSFVPAYGCLWLHLGGLWVYICSYGCSWLLLAAYGCLLLKAAYGLLRLKCLPVATDGWTCLPMAIHGCP